MSNTNKFDNLLKLAKAIDEEYTKATREMSKRSAQQHVQDVIEGNYEPLRNLLVAKLKKYNESPEPRLAEFSIFNNSTLDQLLGFGQTEQESVDEPDVEVSPEYVIGYTTENEGVMFGAIENVWPVAQFYATPYLSNDDILTFNTVDEATDFLAEIEEHTQTLQDKNWTVLVLQVSDIQGVDMQAIIELKRENRENLEKIDFILNKLGE